MSINSLESIMNLQGTMQENSVDAPGFVEQLVGILRHAGAMLPKEVVVKTVVLLVQLGWQAHGGHDEFEQVWLVEGVVKAEFTKAFEELAALELFANEVDDGFFGEG